MGNQVKKARIAQKKHCIRALQKFLASQIVFLCFFLGHDFANIQLCWIHGSSFQILEEDFALLSGDRCEYQGKNCGRHESVGKSSATVGICNGIHNKELLVGAMIQCVEVGSLKNALIRLEEIIGHHNANELKIFSTLVSANHRFTK